MKTQSDVELQRAQAARLEFIRWKCSDLPSYLADLLPVTSLGTELAAAEKSLRAIFEENVATYQRELQSPWVVESPLPTLLDWTGFSGTELYAQSLKWPAPILALPPIKHGSGVDPADGTTKRFILFREVRNAAYSANVGEFWEIEAIYYPKLKQYTDAEAAGDAEKVATLKSELDALNRQKYQWRRDWEIRVAGPNGEKAKRIHSLQDESNRLSDEAYGDAGPEIRFCSKENKMRRDAIEAEISQLKKEIQK